jgi:small-conductance mechanosensitive channel
MSFWTEPIIGSASPLDLIAFTILVIAAAVVGRTISWYIRTKLDDRMGLRFSKSLARLALYVIVGSAILIGFSRFLQMDFSGLVVSLGILGFAIAFASQQIIQNLLSGMLISVTRTIQLEDWVEVGGSPGTGICKVTDINLLSIVLRDVDGRMALVPNSLIINGKVINYTRAGFVSVAADLWIDAATDLEVVRQIVLEEADRDPRILPQVTEEERKIVLKVFARPTIRNILEAPGEIAQLDPQVDIVDLRANKVKISIRVWLRQVNRKDEIMSGFLEALRERFKEAHIELRDP